MRQQNTVEVKNTPARADIDSEYGKVWIVGDFLWISKEKMCKIFSKGKFFKKKERILDFRCFYLL
jgi:hypothetical protein